MKSELEVIEDILDEFDFNKVHKVMEFLEWGWTDGPYPTEVPTIGQLRKRARELMKYCIEHEEFYTATGGFHVFKRTYDNLPFYRLMFVVSDWDNYE